MTVADIIRSITTTKVTRVSASMSKGGLRRQVCVQILNQSSTSSEEKMSVQTQ